MYKKSHFALLTAFVIVFSLMVSVAPVANAADGEVRIAVLQPRPSKGLYFYGTWAIQGFKIGLQYATGAPSWEGPYTLDDGREVVIKIFDTEGDPAVGVSKARQAITSWGADVLFGTSHSPVATSVERIAETYQVPYFISPAASASLTQKPKFNKYIFRIGRNSWHDAKGAAYYYGRMEDVNSIGIIAIDNTFGQLGAETAIESFAEYDVETVAEEYPPAGTKNFKPYLQRIKNKNPDMLWITWAGSGFAPLYQAISNLDMMDMVIGSVIDLFTMNNVNLLSGGLYVGAQGFCYFAYDVNSGPQYDFLVETMQKNDIRPDAFAKAYSQKEGDVFDKISKINVPELFTGSAFASAQFIVEGLERVDGTDPISLIKVWEGMELKTCLGDTMIRPGDHQAVRPIYIAEAVMDKPDDDMGTARTEGLIIGKRIEKVPREHIDPPIKTDYEPISEED